MFEALYDNPWVATAALAAVSIAGYAMWLRRQSFLVAYVGLFTLLAVGDALRSGPWSPLHLLASPWEDAIGIGFVLLGDFRYFLVVERFAVRPKSGALDDTSPKAWATAIGLTFIVPVLSLVLTKAFSTTFAGRWGYLIYELMFIALAVGLRSLVLPKRLAAAPEAVRRWLLGITHFEIALYALWALADLIIIFTKADAGFALRIVPNVMYYGLFVLMVAFRAPAEVKDVKA
ncbi:MAG: hypothetical protein QOI41_1489 [Myxococcales bacterium]|nr:hypothetical protein [Myxococcales bacterium]